MVCCAFSISHIFAAREDRESSYLGPIIFAWAPFTGTDASIRYSETGINWPADYVTSISQADLINGLAYGNDKFIGVGNGLYAYHSNDGIEWGQSFLDSIISYNDVAFGEYNNQSPWLPYFVSVGNS